MHKMSKTMWVLQDRGSRGLCLERVYRLLYDPELHLASYGKIYRNDGAMTPGIASGEGSAGGGLVSVTLDGKGGLKQVKIDDSLMKPDEREIVEDLLVAAHADARARLEDVMQERMKEVTGGLPLPPGMKLF